MDAYKTLTKRIKALTKKIKKSKPELSNNISEITPTNPEEKKPHLRSKELQEYYDALIAMIRKYKPDYFLQK